MKDKSYNKKMIKTTQSRLSVKLTTGRHQKDEKIIAFNFAKITPPVDSAPMWCSGSFKGGRIKLKKLPKTFLHLILPK